MKRGCLCLLTAVLLFSLTACQGEAAKQTGGRHEVPVGESVRIPGSKAQALLYTKPIQCDGPTAPYITPFGGGAVSFSADDFTYHYDFYVIFAPGTMSLDLVEDVDLYFTDAVNKTIIKKGPVYVTKTPYAWTIEGSFQYDDGDIFKNGDSWLFSGAMVTLKDGTKREITSDRL